MKWRWRMRRGSLRREYWSEKSRQPTNECVYMVKIQCQPLTPAVIHRLARERIYWMWNLVDWRVVIG